MAKMTYGRLDRMLRSLGFSVRTTKDEKGRIYEHTESGAQLSFPNLPSTDEVRRNHLFAVHITLNSYGIEEPAAFAASVPR